MFIRRCFLIVLLLGGWTMNGFTEPVISVWSSSEVEDLKLSPGEALSWSKEAPASTTLINVDPSITYQSILGMGASLEHATCWNLSQLEPEKRAGAIESLVCPEKGIGMNLMRLCIGTSDFVGEPWYSYNDLPEGETDLELEQFSIEKDREYMLPAIKIAQEKNPDLIFFSSPWSPPGWMKTNGSMLAGKMKPEYYDVYARYFVKYIEAYAAEGIPVYAVTPQNEPGFPNKDYPTCLWTGEEQRDFIRDHLGPQFVKNGIGALIWCWDHNWNNLAFPRAVLSDPEAARYVDGTGFHHYAGKVEAQTQFRNEFPDKHLYFTEGSTFRTRGAIQIINILRNWARSYNAWVIMLDEKRKPNNGPHSASATCIELKDDLSVEYRYDYYMYGQFMKFIPRGAVRIASTEGERSFANVAFQTPGGDIVMVVANAMRSPREFSVRYGDVVFNTALGGYSVATYRWPAKNAS